ncbi:MBL fold metallo-hydrolase [Pseudooceanicola sp. C21-150M6]|uniref:MBL fold metallo-hydrolase n=1 Tax=Pseudooceanicola sp. C21-150M6 TaxID=3434355 RepID=UPI003D7FECAE
MHQPDTFSPIPGRAEVVAPGVRRILCDNPSPYTFVGTNTYLVGQGGGVAVIDPGPLDALHQEAILAALAPGEKITHILVTHAHGDHSPLARPLADVTGAPVLAYGDYRAGQSEVMQRLAAEADLGGGEGTDRLFAPDESLPDGAKISGDGWRLQAIWTPGHFCNHLCFDLDAGAGYGTIFSGDLVMGWASSLVSPPDGDLTQFMESCAKMRARPARLYLPGHGDVIADPAARVDWLIAHRLGREAGILEALAAGPGTASDLAARVYTDIAPQMLPAAARNVLAQLIDLMGKNKVTVAGELSFSSVFSLA